MVRPDAAEKRRREPQALIANEATGGDAALEHDEVAEALFGLGIVLWWLGKTEPSVRPLERAYAAFRQRPHPEQAALAAVYLCLLYRASLGNLAASRGCWRGRHGSSRSPTSSR